MRRPERLGHEHTESRGAQGSVAAIACALHEHGDRCYYIPFEYVGAGWGIVVVVQDGRGIPISRIDVREILSSANERAARDLASEIKRLRAQIASTEAEIQRYQTEKTPPPTVAENRITELQEHNRLLIESAAETAGRLQQLTESATETARKLQQSERKLTEALIEIATLAPDNERLRAEHAVISQRAAELEEHNRLLTESAIETARKLQQCEGKLTETLIDIATLAPENERLRVDHAVILERAAEIEEHHQLITASATETARKLQESDAELTQTRIEAARKLQESDAELTRTRIQIATLAPENERLRAEHAVISQRAAELEEHNQLLTASVTETARKLQERDVELTRMQIQVATLAPEDERLRAEHAEISQRAAALQEHNRLLTESATETARKLQEREAELTRAQIEIATLAPENARLRAELADISQRAAKLEEHTRGYRVAIDSGVYLYGVDSSQIGGRLPVAREEIGDPVVFLIIGQSNGGNHGETRFSASEAVFNFNPFDGLYYRARDPLLGATGDGGSPWCLLGDALIRNGFARSILLCPLSVGGATVAEWAPGGPYHQRLTYAVTKLREAELRPSHVLWHQGEADALYGTSAKAYVRSFRALVKSLRSLDVTAPIYVATASYFVVPEGYATSQTIIRKAQLSLIDPKNAVLPGPDTDLIRDRFDGCHMGCNGLKDHARAWQAVLEGTPHHCAGASRRPD